MTPRQASVRITKSSALFIPGKRGIPQLSLVNINSLMIAKICVCTDDVLLLPRAISCEGGQ